MYIGIIKFEVRNGFHAKITKKKKCFIHTYITQTIFLWKPS